MKARSHPSSRVEERSRRGIESSKGSLFDWEGGGLREIEMRRRGRRRRRQKGVKIRVPTKTEGWSREKGPRIGYDYKE